MIRPLRTHEMICDQCGTTVPLAVHDEYANADPPVGWRIVRHPARELTLDGDPLRARNGHALDFCSWRCLTEYGRQRS